MNAATKFKLSKRWSASAVPSLLKRPRTLFATF